MGYADQVNDFRNGMPRPVTKDSDAVHERNLEILNGATPKAQTAAAEKAGQVESGQVESSEDATMSWGRGGSTELNRERGQETIPPGAAEGLGINPGPMEHAVSPVPSTFGKPQYPDANERRSWNAAEIFSNTKVG